MWKLPGCLHDEGLHNVTWRKTSPTLEKLRVLSWWLKKCSHLSAQGKEDCSISFIEASRTIPKNETSLQIVSQRLSTVPQRQNGNRSIGNLFKRVRERIPSPSILSTRLQKGKIINLFDSRNFSDLTDFFSFLTKFFSSGDSTRSKFSFCFLRSSWENSQVLLGIKLLSKRRDENRDGHCERTPCKVSTSSEFLFRVHKFPSCRRKKKFYQSAFGILQKIFSEHNFFVRSTRKNRFRMAMSKESCFLFKLVESIKCIESLVKSSLSNFMS